MIFNQIYVKLLSSKQKKTTYFLMFAMLIGTLLEVMSIGMIIPILGLISQDNYIDILQNFGSLGLFLSSFDQDKIIFIFLAFLLLIYFVKNIYLALLVHFQISFVFNLQKELSYRLFSNYVNRDYSFFVSRNSSQLIQNIIGEIGVLINNFLMPAIIFILEILVLISIVALIFYIQPVGTSVIIVFFLLCSSFFYFILRNKILKWGNDRQENESLIIKTLQNGFSGIKDIKIFSVENKFQDYFKKFNNKVADSVKKLIITQQLPRLGLELLAAISFVIVATMLYQSLGSFKSSIPTLGLFAASAFRIMPSINRLINSAQNIKFSIPSLITLENEFDEISKTVKINNEKKIINKMENKIEIKNLKFSYNNSKKLILDDVSFIINKGSRIGIIGESGSGKTTLVDLVLGLLSPTDGRIIIDGQTFYSNNYSLKNIMSYIPQDIYLLDDTIEENIHFGSKDSIINKQQLKKAIVGAQLFDFIQDLPDKEKTIIGERGMRISGGQRQRIGIARALYKEPSIIFFDEATSALDTETESNIMKLVDGLSKDITIIIVTHRMSTIEKCDQVYLIRNKKLIKQKPTNENK